MNKEPIGLYIFRFVMGFGVFAFMAMLYWSSVVLEEKVHEEQADLAEVKNDLFILRGEIDKTHDDIMRALLENLRRPSSSSDLPQPVPQTSMHPHMDPKLPNLLQEDPFYATTLPKLLGPDFKPHGTFMQATIGRPVNLHPFSNWQNVSSWHELCSAAVSALQFGKYETFAPDMAVKMELRERDGDSAIEYWVFLRDNMYWHPLSTEMFSEPINMAPHFLRRHKVTANDFKFYFDALMNPYVQEAGAIAMRTYLGDLEELTVVDELTFIARWKAKEVTEADGTKTRKAKYISKQMTGGLRPLASFVYQYFPNGKKIIDDDSDPATYRTNSVWGQNFGQHWARNIIPSCGPWVLRE